LGSARDGWQAPRLPLAKHNETLCFLGGRAPLCTERRSAIESARYVADPARPHPMTLRPGWPRPSRASVRHSPHRCPSGGLREQLVSGSDDRRATDPLIKELDIEASEDALLLLI